MGAERGQLYRAGPGDSRSPLPGKSAPPLLLGDRVPAREGDGRGPAPRCRELRAPRSGDHAVAVWAPRPLESQWRWPGGQAAECGAPARVPAGLFFPGGRRAGLEAPGPGRPRPGSGLGSSGRSGASSCCTSLARVFFGKLHVFSSLVSVSPERGTMSHRGAHSPGVGSLERGRRPGSRGRGD